MATVRKDTFDGLPSFWLEVPEAGLAAEVIPALGGVLNQLKLSIDGKSYDVVDGFADLAEFEAEGGRYFKGAKLFPFPNRIPEGKYVHDGVAQELVQNFPHEGNAIHGLVWDQAFNVDSFSHDWSSARISMSLELKERAGYPFNCKLVIVYELSADEGLKVTTLVENLGATSMPVGDGWHHYFKLGEGSTDQLQLVMDADYQYIVDAGIPVGKRQLNGIDYDTMAGVEIDVTNHLAKSGNGEVQLINRDLGVALVIQAKVKGGPRGYDFAHVYTHPDRMSIAVEPTSCPANAFNSKDHLIVLEPKQVLQLQWGAVLRGVGVSAEREAELQATI